MATITSNVPNVEHHPVSDYLKSQFGFGDELIAEIIDYASANQKMLPTTFANPRNQQFNYYMRRVMLLRPYLPIEACMIDDIGILAANKIPVGLAKIVYPVIGHVDYYTKLMSYGPLATIVTQQLDFQPGRMLPLPDNLDPSYFDVNLGWLENLLRCGVTPFEILLHFCTKRAVAARFNPGDRRHLSAKQIVQELRVLCKQEREIGFCYTKELCYPPEGYRPALLSDICYSTFSPKPEGLSLVPDEVSCYRVWQWCIRHVGWCERYTRAEFVKGIVISIHHHTLVNAITEADLPPDGSLNLSPKAIEEKYLRNHYFSQLKRVFSPVEFPQLDLPPHPNITPLKTILALHNEGVVMHHCVGGYDQHCLGGHAYIFHVDDDSEHGVTVEVNRYGGIVQAMGYKNQPSESGMAVMRVYLDANGIVDKTPQGFGRGYSISHNQLGGFGFIDDEIFPGGIPQFLGGVRDRLIDRPYPDESMTHLAITADRDRDVGWTEHMFLNHLPG